MHEIEARSDDSEGTNRSRGSNEDAYLALGVPPSERIKHARHKHVTGTSMFRLEQSRNKTCAAWLAALQLSSCLPTVEALQLFGMEVGAGIATIFGVIMFLFIVPCITKLIHIIRKSHPPLNHPPRVSSACSTSACVSVFRPHLCFLAQTCKSISCETPTSSEAVTKSSRMRTTTKTCERVGPYTEHTTQEGDRGDRRRRTHGPVVEIGLGLRHGHYRERPGAATRLRERPGAAREEERGILVRSRTIGCKTGVQASSSVCV
jgi:hypothetical protein